MTLKVFHASLPAALLVCVGMMLPVVGYAQTIPNAADISRIKPEEKIPRPERTLSNAISIPAQKSASPVPSEAKSIKFTLKRLNIIGATVFSNDDLGDIFSQDIDKEITLDRIYDIASAITARYRDAGYFLSRAFVPAQEIEKGNVTIKVIEGYVGSVDGASEYTDVSFIRNEIEKLTKQRPLSSKEMERFLLLLNDLPGHNFGGVLSPLEDAHDGAVKLTLTATKVDGVGSVSYDNFSSRFLGPHEVTASYSKSLIPFQQTTISALSDVDRSKLRYGTLSHTIPLMSDLRLELSGGITQALPGYSLESSQIESLSKFASASFEYQWIRQRQQNLSIKAALDGRNVTSDILGAPLTRDYIRALRLTGNYDVVDGWMGSNNVNLTVSHGINWLSSSNPNDPDLSRVGALPDFTKVEASLSRLQSLTHDWSAYIAGSGQWATGVLYSSEQFGYGGQSFGRAYDPSDITGDRGLKGAFELRYSGLTGDRMVDVQPYGFYDIGVVWNNAAGQPPEQSASSFGAGIRFNTIWKQSGNIGLAWPIDRNIAIPIFNNGGVHGPRIILQISQQF